MIQLYNYDERDFQGHNGRVLSGVSNDTITWVLNSQFEFQFDYPLFSKHGLEIKNEMIVTAPVPGYDDQAFRVNSIEKSMGVLTVHAYHVFWDLMQNFVEDINIVNKTGEEAIEHVMESTQFPHEFTALSTVGNVASTRIVRMSVIAALIGTDDNTILSRWGGEYEWDNFHFNYVAKLGEDRGVVFRNGKNLLGYKATEDLTNTVTRIMPEGYNGLFLPELYVDSPLIDNYTSPRIAKITYSDIKAIDENSLTTGDDADPDALPLDEALAALRNAARDEFASNHVDQPGQQFELNVVMLEDTEEYKNRGIFSRVYPGDTARFIHDEDGLDVRARMTGYTWRPSTQEYLTQSYYSSAELRGGNDVEHQINNISNQLKVIDQLTMVKAANHSNTIGWSSDVPPEIKGSKNGDIWYQQVGIHVVMWMYHDGKWQEAVSDIAGKDASNIVNGTINAANVNVINLNANNIVTGSISGKNLSLNLNTGEVKFQSGIIRSADEDFEIDVDNGTVSSSKNGTSTVELNNGGLNYRASKNGTLSTGRVSLNMYDEASNWPTLAVQSLGRIILSAAKEIDDMSNPSKSTMIEIDKNSIVINGAVGDTSIGLPAYNSLAIDDDTVTLRATNLGTADYSSIFMVASDKAGGAGATLGISSAKGIEIADGGNGTHILGNFSVSGSKNAIHITRDGVRATPAYEMAESYLGDLGEGRTDSNGKICIKIEELFRDTVNTRIPYQVFLQSYSSASVWVSSRDEDFFVVNSDKPNALFSWELKAKRRNYENDRLVRSEMSVQDYAKEVDGMESDKND